MKFRKNQKSGGCGFFEFANGRGNAALRENQADKRGKHDALRKNQISVFCQPCRIAAPEKFSKMFWSWSAKPGRKPGARAGGGAKFSEFLNSPEKQKTPAGNPHKLPVVGGQIQIRGWAKTRGRGRWRADRVGSGSENLVATETNTCGKKCVIDNKNPAITGKLIASLITNSKFLREKKGVIDNTSGKKVGEKWRQ